MLSTPHSEEGQDPVVIPIVSVGAMLVGSIGHTRAEGVQVERAEELGYFAYGGKPFCDSEDVTRSV